ncbi:MAG: putative DNA binding domain-containing protein [Muribaculaceae bacterium]|nr:putative DNA binding domain-containing protein [Muribaculaceae bacterium]
MNANTIKQMCQLGENSQVQFKLRLENANSLAAEIVAMANSRGGTILFGVEDKTGKVIGLDYEQLQRINSTIANVATNNIQPPIYVLTDTIPVDGKAVMVISVPEGGDKPYKDNSGAIWVKQGGDKRRVVSNEDILSLFQQSGNYRPDQAGVRGTTISDIDNTLLDDYLFKFYGKRSSAINLPLENLLRNLQIATDDGRLTLAGLMFFGREPQRFEPAMGIKAVRFYGNDMAGMRYYDSRDFVGTIPRLFEQGFDFLNSNLHHVQNGQSFNSVGVLEVSGVALSELLQNALVHRDYLQQAPVRIMIFDNRVEIVSPGGLPSGIDVEAIRFGRTCQRNPLMASFCAKLMDYRGLGTGILRAAKEEPELQLVDDNGIQFKAIIMRRRNPDLPVNMASEPITEYVVSSRQPVDWRQRCPALGRGDEAAAQAVYDLCRVEPQSVPSMMRASGYGSRSTFRRRVLLPLLDAGVLEPTDAASPNSPRQRYRIADGGTATDVQTLPYI